MFFKRASTWICLERCSRCSQNDPNNLSCQTIASSCFSPFPDGLGEKMSGFRLGLQGLGEARLISSTATHCKISQCQGLQFFSTPSWQHLVCLGAKNCLENGSQVSDIGRRTEICVPGQNSSWLLQSGATSSSDFLRVSESIRYQKTTPRNPDR